MPTILTGAITDQGILSNERVVDMSEIISMLDPDASQFYTALDTLGSKPAQSSLVEWLEDQYFPRVVTLSGSIDASQTTASIRVGEANYVRFGDLIRLADTGECIFIAGVTGTSALSIVRSIGTVAGATAASRTQGVVVGNATAQGATLGTRQVTQRSRAYNYTQIFRHPYGFTETLAASKLYGGPEPGKERRKKAVEHKAAMEMAFFQGARDFDTTDIRGYVGGAYEYISTNVTTGTNMTENSFDDFLRTALFRGSKNKVGYAAPRVAAILSGMLRDGWVRARPEEKVFGAHVDAWVSSAYGWEIPINVKRDWNEFNAVAGQEDIAMGSMMFVIDLDATVLRPLRPTRLLTNRQANSADEISEEYLTEVSLEFRSEAKHALLQGVS